MQAASNNQSNQNLNTKNIDSIFTELNNLIDDKSSKEFYKNFSSYIAFIFILSNNKYKILIRIDQLTKNLFFLIRKDDSLAGELNATETISENKSIFSDYLIKEKKSICNIKYDYKNKKFSIQEKKSSDDSLNDMLTGNIFYFSYCIKYFLSRSFVKSIGGDAEKHLSTHINAYLTAFLNIKKNEKALNYFEKKEMVEIKKKFYTTILLKLKSIIEQFQPFDSEIIGGFDHLTEMIILKRDISEVLIEDLKVKSIDDVIKKNNSFATKIMNIVHNFEDRLNVSIKKNRQEKFDKKRLENVIKQQENRFLPYRAKIYHKLKYFSDEEYKNMPISKNILNPKIKNKDQLDKIIKIMDDFHDFIKNIQYNHNFNNKLFEQSDEVSKSVQEKIKDVIEKITELKAIYIFLFNLFNSQKFFGNEINEINYHNIYNIYKNPNSNYYQSIKNFVENILNTHYIYNLIQVSFFDLAILSKYELKNFFLKSIEELAFSAEIDPSSVEITL